MSETVKTKCPRCERLFGNEGLRAHLPAKHGISWRQHQNALAREAARAQRVDAGLDPANVKHLASVPTTSIEEDDDDLGAMFRAQREATKEHRAKMLEQADTTGWEELTEFHFRRYFGDTRIDWWPSGGKAMRHVKGSGRPPFMVYGRGNVARMIGKLKEAHPDAG